MKKQNSVKKSDYHFVISSEEIKKTLNEKMEIGKAQFQEQIFTEEDFKKQMKAHQSWKDYLKEYLKRSCSDDTISEEFSNSSFSMAFSVNPTFHQKIQDFKNSFDREITYIESLLNRIDLIPDKSENIKSHTKEAPMTWSTKLLHPS